MNIGLYHGYELTGSGSNEYTRYLARYFVELGHTVHLICREYSPQTIGYVTDTIRWQPSGEFESSRIIETAQPRCFLHQLPQRGAQLIY